MIKGKTTTGFKFEVDEGIKDSFEFLRNIKKANSKDPDEQVNGTYSLIAMLLGGEDGVDRLLDHLKKVHSTNYPTVLEVSEEIKEIISAIPQIKN